MNKLASDLRSHVGPPSWRDLLDVEWIAIVLATGFVCLAAFVLDTIL